MKIVFLDDATIGAMISLDPIKELGEYTGYANSTSEQVAERCADCDVIITNKVKLGRNEIDACKNLKLICEAATGTNNIDVAYATEKGIPVKNVAGYSTESVVQLTFSHILSLVNSCRYFDDSIKKGEYSKRGLFTDVTTDFTELDGKNIGIVGMGAIGSRVAEVAKAFKMNVSYFSTSGTSHCTEYPSLSLEELLKQSDIISIHAPLNAKTNNLITYKELCMMKKSAIIVNMGRGGIINEEDLARAIDEGIIAGAALDVFTTEPIPENHAFMNIKNKDRVQFSPHIGWASVEARKRLVDGVAENIRKTLSL